MANADDAISAQLANAQRSAEEYAQESTRLSKYIQSLESFLNDLPAKVETSVGCTIGDLHCELVFKRGGTRWPIVVRFPGGSELLLAACGVEVKLDAALSLPALVHQLSVAQQHQLGRLRESNKRLDSLLSSLQSVGKERA